MTEHLPALNVQGDVANVPVPLVVQLTVPVGVELVPEDVSATVAVHVVTLLTTMLAGAQTTEVDVDLRVTVTVVVPAAPAE